MSLTNQKKFIQSGIEYFWEINKLEKQLYHNRKKFTGIFSGKNEYSLHDLLVLMMFYGTHLDINEIVGIKISDLEKINMGRYKIKIKNDRYNNENSFDLSQEISTVLNYYLPEKKSEYLFTNQSGNPLSSVELLKIIQSYSNEKLLQQIGVEPGKASTDQYMVLPTSARLQAEPTLTGKGVTIAFIDSGFYPHPDLTQPQNRILKYVDITGKNIAIEDASVTKWHGQMTSVSCAGNGYCSNGLYSGIARDANLVLLAVGNKNGGIDTKNIIKAIEWIISNKDEFNIRILNISLGSGSEISFRESEIDQAAELAVQAGIVVVAAAGNNTFEPSTPPANSPSVITVGGLNDKNIPFETNFSPYHSQYGITVDGLIKPEIIAPGILVAAPVLPGTPTFHKASALFYLKAIPDNELEKEINKFSKVLNLKKNDLKLPVNELRSFIEKEINSEKLISPYYQHVEGTSFAAPIVCSVIAQMLEVNPTLTPGIIREILISTAKPIPHIPRERQGYGCINPMEAVEAAKSKEFVNSVFESNFPIIKGNMVQFRLKDNGFNNISVAGTFNQWNSQENKLIKNRDYWETTIEITLPGQYYYKFVVDNQYWIEDSENPNSEPDFYGGVNSVFEITEYSYSGESLNDIFRIIHTESEKTLKPEAMSALSFILKLYKTGKSVSARDYFIKCFEIALEHLEKKVPENKIEIIMLYNCGLIIRNNDFSIGIDLVSTRHVWGVNWVIPEKYVQKLIKLTDVFFVTHKLPDHLDLDILLSAIRQGKPVIVPDEDKQLISHNCKGVLAATGHELMIRNHKLKFTSHRGFHSFDQENIINQRVYQFEISNKNILFLADHDYTKYVDFNGKIDCLIAKFGMVNQDINTSKSIEILFKKVQPKHFIPVHISELGQPDVLNSESYDFVEEYLKNYPVISHVLTWGEKTLI